MFPLRTESRLHVARVSRGQWINIGGKISGSSVANSAPSEFCIFSVMM